MNFKCQLTRKTGAMYRTVMGPTRSVFPTLCDVCILEHEVNERITKLEMTLDSCTDCQEPGVAEDAAPSKVTPVSRESFEAAKEWGWTC